MARLFCFDENVISTPKGEKSSPFNGTLATNLEDFSFLSSLEMTRERRLFHSSSIHRPSSLHPRWHVGQK